MNVSRRRGVALRMLVIGLFVTACSVERLPVAGSATAPSSAPISTASPIAMASARTSAPPSAAPVATAEPSASAYTRPVIPVPDLDRPALQFPDLESYGAARVTLTLPDQTAITSAMSCLWHPGGEYSEPGVVRLRRFSIMLAGEQAEIWLGTQTSFGDSLEFAIHRHGAASYVAGPGTGSAETVGVAQDGSSGTMRFDGLAPSPETAPPLRASLAEWVRPLGEDPAMAMLKGIVEWACESPPPYLPEAPYSCVLPPGPLCLGDPLPIVLVVDGRSRDGVNACGGLSGETCGPPLYALPADYIVGVPTGQMLRFELPDERSHFVRWSLKWAPQSDAERWQMQYEFDFEGPYEDEAWEMIDEGGLSEGSTLEFAAPRPGDWSVQLGWTDDRDDEGGNMTSYFRVVVGD